VYIYPIFKFKTILLLIIDDNDLNLILLFICNEEKTIAFFDDERMRRVKIILSFKIRFRFSFRLRKISFSLTTKMFAILSLLEIRF